MAAQDLFYYTASAGFLILTALLAILLYLGVRMFLKINSMIDGVQRLVDKTSSVGSGLNLLFRLVADEILPRIRRRREQRKRRSG